MRALVARLVWTFVPTLPSICASIAYLLTAGICFRAARTVSGGRSLWLMITSILLILAIDRMIGIHNWISNAARQVARQEGYYENRYPIQKAIIATVLFCGLFAGAFVFRLLRRRNWQQKVGVAGMIAVLCVALVRVVSYHRLDDYVEMHVLGVQLVFWLEYAAIIPVALAGFLERPSNDDSSRSAH